MNFLPMSGCPGILIHVHGPNCDSPDWAFDYVGAPSDLVAAGICTADMLAPAANKVRRVDADGIHYRVKRWFVRREGLPIDRCKIEFGDRPADLALKIPGAATAMSAWWLATAAALAETQRPKVVDSMHREIVGALERPSIRRSATRGNVIYLCREEPPAV